MVMKLKVMIGPNRFDMAIAHVNDQSRPTEIDTELFAGRVVVYVKDFRGITPPGAQPVKEHPYFAGRSRKFAILIEGRFKHRQGVAPYSGAEIQFGSDFDFLPDSFPQGPFGLGLKVAQRVDPATTAVMKPDHGRPYIMSPYLACMNTFAAYPAPDAVSRALVQAQHDAAHPHKVDGHETDVATFVPREEVGTDGKSKATRHDLPYWRFVGIRGHPATEAYVEKHKHLLAPVELAPSRRALYRSGSALSIGTSLARVEEDPSDSSTPNRPPNRTRQGSPDGPSGFMGWGAPIPGSNGDESPEVAQPKKKSASKRFSLAGLMGTLEKESKESSDSFLQQGDLITADQLNHGVKDDNATGVAKHLGPWRFSDPNVDAIEDSLFIFLDSAHNRSVAQRRKWFVQNSGQNRNDFFYSPDVVYTTSFFTSFCDLNTFDLKMGPVSLNIANYFTEQPIRYTLRSTRMAPRPDGKPGPEEEEAFCSISFQLVDEQ